MKVKNKWERKDLKLEYMLIETSRSRKQKDNKKKNKTTPNPQTWKFVA